MKNIILIGMPGAGKSTTGVILAKVLGRRFIDTDIAIQERTGRLLQEILDKEGPETFKEIEEETVLAQEYHNAVIATGGSVVFSNNAMNHLKQESVIVYLTISYEEMEKRLRNLTTRGVVLRKGQSLRDMYNERVPLYGKYADITIDCNDDFDNCTADLIGRLRKLMSP
jgi:shikimate kinase